MNIFRSFSKTYVVGVGEWFGASSNHNFMPGSGSSTQKVRIFNFYLRVINICVRPPYSRELTERVYSAFLSVNCVFFAIEHCA